VLVAQGIVELLVDAIAGCCRGVRVLTENFFLVVERVILGWWVVVFIGALLGPEATRLGGSAPEGRLFLVWCLRTVEWMRASLWSSC
jgi:hypothetical protein